MDFLPRAFLEQRVLDLRIPYSAGCSSETCVESIDGVDAAAAASKAESDSDDEYLISDGEDGEVAVLVHNIRVRTLPIAGSIGGKLWDSSLLLSAWLFESSDRFPPPAEPGSRQPRLLELGSGLGVAGLAASIAFPSLHVTLSDYDPAVLENLKENIRLNSGNLERHPDVALVDFRDFTKESVSRQPLPAELHKYEDAGLYGQVDMIIAADVVYDSGHNLLAQVCLALLAKMPADESRWQPCAVFLLPNGRPRLRDFVTQLAEAGLTCRIERILPTCDMIRRLRRAHEGWGAGTSFSLYFVTRMGRPLLAA